MPNQPLQVAKERLYGRLVTMCQAYGITTRHTEELLTEVLESICTEQESETPAASVEAGTDCATCDNSRFVPSEPENAESLSTPCPDCSRITKAIQKAYLADPTQCPWCQGTLQADAAPEVDEGFVTQEIDCTECNRSWSDLYTIVGMRSL